eukprot:CCRYP_000115-RB/>CCRYP_000115-RB protein AED:0.42 eAED:0.58 QI:0/-1/0/1/-1/0/1/0/205
MYTNIPTEPAIACISAYRSIHGKPFQHYHPQTLIDAIEIAFRNNVIQFGDTYWRQISGTGMGISPPPWATIFYAYMKTTSSLPGLITSCSTNDSSMMFLVYGYPTHPPHKIPSTGAASNKPCNNGMAFNGTSPLSTSCNFMDLTITITPSGHLSTPSTLKGTKPLPIHPTPLCPPFWHALRPRPRQYSTHPPTLLIPRRHQTKIL